MSDFTISKTKNDNASITAVDVYNAGIARLIELSNEVWTDYNKHDPGVSFLEVLSYLVTELQFKTDWPIQDVLVDGIDDANQAAKQAINRVHFPSPDKILPSAALTKSDYRKMLIDIPNVNNAWLTPYEIPLFFDRRDNSVSLTKRVGNTITELAVKGAYRVKLLLAEGLNQSEKKAALKAVHEKLNANRNLCEWFDSPSLINKQYFIACGEIELKPQADPIQVSSQIWLAIQHYFSKPIEHQSPEQTCSSLDFEKTLFNGPLLENGFISESDLQASDLKSEIRLSDIYKLIMDIDGVIAIRDLVINPEGTNKALENKWLIAVDGNKQAALKPQNGSLSFFKRELPVFYSQTEALREYRKLYRQSQESSHAKAVYSLEAPIGKNRNIKSYHSVQWDLPAVYGLSEAGLPKDVSEERKAKVLQLKAFLAFFDQVSANFLAQSHHLKSLLSLDKDQVQSYFYQIPESIKDWQKIYDSRDKTEKKLATIIQDKTEDLERRNRFLDFMLSRFGEDMTGLTEIMLNAFEPSLQKTLNYKIDFYNALPEVSKNRGLAHDISLKNQVWNSMNVSGLARRLCRLLGISNPQRRNLSDIAFDIYAEIDKTPDDEFRFRIRNKTSDKILLSSSTNYVTKADAKKEMRLAVQLGKEAQHYELLKTKNNRFYFNIVDSSGEVIARRIEYFKTQTDCRRAIREVIDYLTVNYSEEGLYVLEQWWLLPQKDGDESLAICVDEDCDECVDPYSYQIHIILPAYGKRFEQMDFRRYCEGIIRTEVPAHLLPRICWINKEHMALFERAYKDWLAVVHKASSAGIQKKKKALLQALTEIHNVYPVENLHDCDSEETGFVVGRTALGSFKESS